MKRLLLVVLIAFAIPGATITDSVAHSGGTNANGCHTNRKTGDYHCHTPKARAPGQKTYCHVLKGESRCGYSVRTCEDLKQQFGGYCRAE